MTFNISLARISMVVLILLLLVSITYASALKECPKCGILDVPYPLSSSDYCGNPKYRIYCTNEVLHFMSADGFSYKILSVNPNTSRLVISPPLIQNNTCQSSDLSSGGLRIDENSPFNISSRNTVMLFNCSDNILLSPLNCSSTSPCRQYEEKVIEGRGCNGTLCCSYLKDSSMTSHRIRIRVGGCSAYTSVVDLKPGDPIDVWHYGIELQWLPPINTNSWVPKNETSIACQITFRKWENIFVTIGMVIIMSSWWLIGCMKLLFVEV